MKTGRSIISVALIIAMIFTVSAFAACSKSESEEEVKVNIKIVGASETYFDGEAAVKAVPSEMTILTATQQLCGNIEIEFVYDSELKSVMKIGNDEFDKDALAADLQEEVGLIDENAETVEGEEAATEAPAAADSSYYDWQAYLNGVEATPEDIIKAGDNIEWLWKKFIPEEVK